jgi:hypothetical protein
MPELNGRMAKCTCGRTEPSSHSLAFFQFRGDGSESAVETCKHCAYFRVAHTPAVMAKNSSLKCTNFESRGAYEFDSFYCGCRGWE